MLYFFMQWIQKCANSFFLITGTALEVPGISIAEVKPSIQVSFTFGQNQKADRFLEILK